jgi:hypothetical protein
VIIGARRALIVGRQRIKGFVTGQETLVEVLMDDDDNIFHVFFLGCTHENSGSLQSSSHRHFFFWTVVVLNPSVRILRKGLILYR